MCEPIYCQARGGESVSRIRRACARRRQRIPSRHRRFASTSGRVMSSVLTKHHTPRVRQRSASHHSATSTSLFHRQSIRRGESVMSLADRGSRGRISTSRNERDRFEEDVRSAAVSGGAKKPGAEAPGDRMIRTRCTYRLPSPSSLCSRPCLTRELETRRPCLASDPENQRVA